MTREEQKHEKMEGGREERTGDSEAKNLKLQDIGREYNKR